MIKQLTALFFVAAFFPVIISAQNFNEDRIALTTPGTPWMVLLDGKNLNIRDQKLQPDNKSGYFLFHNEEEGLTASLFIEPADKCKTSEECRDFVWKAGNPQWGEIQNVVQSKIRDISCFEFFRPTYQNRPVQVQDMYAEFVEDGYWVDLHISKVQYKKEEHLLFENSLNRLSSFLKTIIRRLVLINQSKHLEMRQKVG